MDRAFLKPATGKKNPFSKIVRVRVGRPLRSIGTSAGLKALTIFKIDTCTFIKSDNGQFNSNLLINPRFG
jgi:hypothetical protein